MLTASYQTPLGLWQFDVTLQLNGGGRMPAPYELTDGNWSWERRYGGFEQLSAQVTRYFRPLVYIRRWREPDKLQAENPIIDAQSLGSNFDATMVGTDAWGKSLCRCPF